MVTAPIVSEFETQEQADSYDRWFRAKVQASLDDSRPPVAHDEVTAGLTRSSQRSSRVCHRRNI